VSPSAFLDGLAVLERRQRGRPGGNATVSGHLVRVVKRKLKKIQYRPHLIDGWLAATGLTIGLWSSHEHSEFKLVSNHPLTLANVCATIAVHKGRVIPGSVQRFRRGRVLLHA
jgi:hypothetical protein